MCVRLTYLSGASVALADTAELPPSAERYGVTRLPFTIPDSIALNNEGVVAGATVNPDGSISSGKWSKGALTNLGGPPGLHSAFNRVRPFGINDSGAIVGGIYTSAGEWPARAFVHREGSYTVLPLLHPTHAGGVAIGINDRGEVAGFDRTSNHNTQAWLWSDGAYSSLPVSGTSTVAVGINSSGTVVGYRRVNFIQRLLARQFRRSGDMGFVLSHGATHYFNGPVHAINDLGVAAGASTSRHPRMATRLKREATATVFKDGIATSILSLPSAAFGINSSGNVIGSYRAGSGSRAFIWSPTSGAFDITPARYRSAVAAAINNRGDILGYGETASGATEDFLLTPDPNGEVFAQSFPRPSG
jgi:probable HAF family extracellular repeat protein